MTADDCLNCRIGYLNEIRQLRNEVDRYKLIELNHERIINRYEKLIKTYDDLEYNEIKEDDIHDEELEL